MSIYFFFQEQKLAFETFCQLQNFEPDYNHRLVSFFFVSEIFDQLLKA